MKKLLITLVILSLIVGIAYVKLGGAASLDTQLVDRQLTTLQGSYFSGLLDDPKLETLFNTTRQKALNSQSPLYILNYDQDSNKFEVNQFIGVDLANQKSAIQSETVVVAQGAYIEVVIQAHNLVMPDAKKVKQTATTFAESNNLVIDTTVSYEIYESDRNLRVLFKVRE